MASEVGYPDAALGYFLDACAVDLPDAHGNTADGIHIASCGGTWLALVAGFGGLRDFDGEVRFRPAAAGGVGRGCASASSVRGQLLEVDMTHAGDAYRLLEGSALLISHRGEELRIVPGRSAASGARARRGAPARRLIGPIRVANRGGIPMSRARRGSTIHPCRAS